MRPYRNSWIPGRATPDCDPGLPGMTFELCREFVPTGSAFDFHIPGKNLAVR